MEIRIQPYYDFVTKKEVFGLSIRVNGGRRYCKFPMGDQSYETIGDASEAAVKMMERIKNGAHIEYGANGTAGVNKVECVNIVD